MVIITRSDIDGNGSGRRVLGIATFEMEYGYWVEEQHRQNSELRNALQARVTDVELSMLVESGLNHYYNLFRLKEDAAKSDIFYLMSGIWRTSAERFFLWIGGFRPSELLNVKKKKKKKQLPFYSLTMVFFGITFIFALH